MVKSPTTYTPDTDQLVLELLNNKPIRAQDLADLFSAMARDYRAMNRGHHLIVTEIRSGSLIAVLRDLISGISGANALIQFGKSIGQMIEALKGQIPGFAKHEGTVARTVEKLLAAAEHSNAFVSLRYEAQNGNKLLVEFEPHEAPQLAKKIRKTKELKKLGQPNQLNLTDRTSIVRAIEDYGGDKRGIEMIAKILVQKGQKRLITEIADELEQLGRHDTAEILRNAIRKPPAHRLSV